MEIDPYQIIGLSIAIETIIVIPITIFLVKLKSRTDSHDLCLQRLEKKIDDLRVEGKAEAQDVKISTKEDKLNLKEELQTIRNNITSVEQFLRENIPPLVRKNQSNI